MNLKVAFQIDHLNKLSFKSDISTDTSLMLMEKALTMGMIVYFYYPETVSFSSNSGVFAKLYKLEKLDLKETDNQIKFSEPVVFNLEEINILFIRQEPPFDMAYITSTVILDNLKNVTIINSPSGIRNAPEKLLITHFPHLMPKTLISANVEAIMSFVEKTGVCIIKPLYGHAGANVFMLKKDDFNTTHIVEYLLENFKEQMVIQEYLENIKITGDKRIIIVNSKVYGAFTRVPQKDQLRASIYLGSQVLEVELTKQEIAITNEIIPTLVKMGLFFAGLDTIDNKVTEINVTSPGGLAVYREVAGIDLTDKLWADALEYHHKERLK